MNLHHFKGRWARGNSFVRRAAVVDLEDSPTIRPRKERGQLYFKARAEMAVVLADGLAWSVRAPAAGRRRNRKVRGARCGL